MRTFLSLIGIGLIGMFSIFIKGCGSDESDTIEIVEPVKFLCVEPAEGNTILSDATLTLSFDNTPENITVSAGEAAVSGNKVTIKGPFTPGQLSLNVEWDDAFVTLTYTVEAYVEIPDDLLRAEIETELNIISGTPITPKEMLYIVFFKQENVGFADLTGLEYAKRLQIARLNSNRIKDISPLKGMVFLRSLSAWNNDIVDISSLTDLPRLFSLNLANNAIEDISSLEELTQLEYLHLDANHIKDISPLKGLINLIQLSMGENEITDVSALKELKNLRDLFLYDNPIEDISPLVELKDLKQLILQNTRLNDESINKFIPMMEANGTDVSY